MSPSCEQLAIMVPSAQKSTLVTASECAAIIRWHVPRCRSQSLIVSSKPPLTSNVLRGWHATHITYDVWPRNVRIFCPYYEPNNVPTRHQTRAQNGHPRPSQCTANRASSTPRSHPGHARPTSATAGPCWSPIHARVDPPRTSPVSGHPVRIPRTSPNGNARIIHTRAPTRAPHRRPCRRGPPPAVAFRVEGFVAVARSNHVAPCLPAGAPGRH